MKLIFDVVTSSKQKINYYIYSTKDGKHTLFLYQTTRYLKIFAKTSFVLSVSISKKKTGRQN